MKRTRLSARRWPFNIAGPARIIFVVAYDERGTMGRDGALPWHLPADLLHFKALTIGKAVIVGRKTFASIGKPLKLRRNIVLSRAGDFAADGVEIAHSPDEALALAQGAGEIAVIGGAHVFEAFAGVVDSVYATEVNTQAEGDVRYVAPARDCIRVPLGEHPADEANAHGMTFVRFDYTVHPENVIAGSTNESNPSR
ncbi:MAG: dihydrofolate reductase [Candidatus Baltobacteraceae bacterium]